MTYFLYLILFCLGVLLTAPGTIELLFLTIGSLLPAKKKTKSLSEKPYHLAIIIPAHNEDKVISNTIRSLQACSNPIDNSNIFVIADNCTDNTAKIAKKRGIQTLIRKDPIKQGKGHALEFAFNTLSTDKYTHFLVIDADTQVEPNLLAEVRHSCEAGADAIQARYGVLNADESSRTRLMSIAFNAFNYLRPRGRERWGLSAGILGNGFALNKETLDQVPYHAHSITEDLEYHLHLVLAGKKVQFLEHTAVWGLIPPEGKGVATQRARWEGGRLKLAIKMTSKMLRKVVSGNVRLLEPIGDLLLLPLAYHLLLLLLTLIIPFHTSRIYALIALAIVSFHLMTTWILSGCKINDLKALAWAPLYLGWKLLVLPRTLLTSAKKVLWIRTDRF